MTPTASLFRHRAFWGAWTALALIASLSIYGRSWMDGAPVSLLAATVRGFWWIYADAALMVAGFLLMQALRRGPLANRIVPRILLGFSLLCGLILGFRVVQLLLRGTEPTTVGWTTLIHFNVKFAAAIVASAVAVEYLTSLRQRRTLLLQQEERLAAEHARRTRAMLEPLAVQQRIRAIRELIPRDADAANQQLVALAAELRERLELARRPEMMNEQDTRPRSR